MKENPLLKVQTFGQSIWMDYLSRQVIESGELARLVKEDGLRGVTSNPSIFDKAIGGSNDYDDAIHKLARKGKNIEEIYQTMTVEDIQRAADVFRPLYDKSDARHGFVSLEVNPHLAHDTEATITPPRGWKKVLTKSGTCLDNCLNWGSISMM
jgi:transaldolase